MAEKYQRNRNPGVERVPGGWRARYYDVNGKRRSKTFKVQSDAVRWRNEQRRAIERGEWIDQQHSRISFGDMVEIWRASKTTITDKTWATYDSQLRKFLLPAFGHVPISALRPSEISKWMKEQAEAGAGVEALNKALGLMHQILELAVLDGRLSRNPAHGVPRIPHKPKRGPFHVISAQQLGTLLQTCGEYSALVYLDALVGLRWGELVALKVGDFDLSARTLSVTRAMTTDRAGKMIEGPTKTKQTRTIPLVDSLLSVIEPLLAGRDADARVFPGPSGGVLHYAWFRRKVWLPATVAAGLPGFNIHGMRRSCGSLLLSMHAPITTVSGVLGHSSVRTTLEAYAFFYEEDKAPYLQDLGLALDAAAENSKGTEKVLEASEPPAA